MRLRFTILSVFLLIGLAGCDDEVMVDPGLGVPTALSIVEGDDQTGAVGTTLTTPLVVEVTDTTGEPVEGVSVIWSAQQGSVGTAAATTDAFGIAAVNWTLGSVAGEQTVTANVAGVAPITFSATAQPGATVSVEIEDDSLVFVVGDTAQLVARAVDQHGNAVSEADVVWLSLDSAVAKVDSAGELVAVGSGTARVTAESGAATDTVEVTVQNPTAEIPVDWYRAYPLTGMTLYDAWAASAQNIFVVGGSGASPLEEDLGGVILRYDGTYWTRTDTGISTALHAVWGSSGTSVFAVGDEGVILRYNGASWSSMASPTTEHLSGVWGASSTSVFAVGHDGGIFHYDGSQWNVAFSGSLVELNDVWGTSATDVYVVGSGGVIRHWDGSEWTAMATPTTQPLYAIWGTNSSNIYAVGGSGGTAIVLHYDGTAWVERTGVGAVGVLHAVTGTSDTRVMVAGTAGAIQFDGSTWTPMEHSLNPAFYGAGADANGTLHVVGTNGSIFRNEAGVEWQISHSMAPAYDIWAISANEAFRVGAFGTILRFDGTGWIAMESPTTEDLRGVWANNGQSVYAVGSDQILYYNGTSWLPRTTGLTGFFNDVHGIRLTDVYVAGSDGVAHFNGDTWSFVNQAPATAVWGDTLTGVVHAVGGNEAFRFDTEWVAVDKSFGGQFGTSLWGDGPNYLLACSAAGTTTHYDGEEWQPNEINVACTEVHGTSRYDVFAVGSNGQIHHRSGTGLGWMGLIAPDAGLYLYTVFAVEDRVFAGGQAGLILHGDR